MKRKVVQTVLSMALVILLLPTSVYAEENVVAKIQAQVTERVEAADSRDSIVVLEEETVVPDSRMEIEDTGISEVSVEADPAEIPEAQTAPEPEILETLQEDDNLVTVQEDPQEATEPEAPVELTAPALKSCVNKESGVEVSWKPVDNAERYNVYLISAKSKRRILVGETKTTRFEYAKVKSGTTYTFTVTARANESESDYDQTGIASLYLSPVKAKVSRSGNFAVVKWDKADKAQGYILYRRAAGTSKWTRLKTLKALTYKDTKITVGSSYEYMVRAYKSTDKKYYSAFGDFNTCGFSILAAPTLKSLKNTASGLCLKWKKLDGAKKYKVIRKTAGGKWKALKVTTALSYIDKTAKVGKVYYYSVIPFDANNIRGNYNKTGKAGAFYKIPKAPEVTNTDDGVSISWTQLKTATGYRIYRKLSSDTKWKGLKTVSKKGSYVDGKVESGVSYDYLVLPFKTINGSRFCSTYNSGSSASIIRLETPTLKSVSRDGINLLLSWKTVPGAKKYGVYRKSAEEQDWKLLKTVTKLEYADKKAEKGKLYSYTVSAIADNSVSHYGSKNLSGILLSEPVLKKLTSSENGLTLTWNKVAGATNYRVYRILASGKLKKIGTTTEPSFTDTKVQADTKYTYTVFAFHSSCMKCFSPYDAEGLSATFTDPVRTMAKNRLKQCGGTLRSAYNWAVSIPYNKSQPAVYNASGYAKWSFQNSAGDCLGKAAVFLMMARELGYECYLMYGYVPQRGGGMVDHGWVEIVDDGVTYICDPDFEYESHNNGYFINYGQSGTWMYTDYRRLP